MSSSKFNLDLKGSVIANTPKAPMMESYEPINVKPIEIEEVAKHTPRHHVRSPRNFPIRKPNKLRGNQTQMKYNNPDDESVII